MSLNLKIHLHLIFESLIAQTRRQEGNKYKRKENNKLKIKLPKESFINTT